MQWKRNRALVALRNSFREAGYREQEREVIYALRIGDLEKNNSGLLSWLNARLEYVLFELTTEWGRRPARALVLLFTLIPIFAIPYALALWARQRDGIWRIWMQGRAREDLGSNKPELITAGPIEAVGLGLYFSLMSAFHLGWRDFNAGSWISRLHPREYTLQASGWVRTVSGVQSLISTYLLLLWALTYFGRPFG